MSKWIKTRDGEYVNLDMCSEIRVDKQTDDNQAWSVMVVSINNPYELYRGSREECNRFVEGLVGL